MLYGKEIKVAFYILIREEKRFDSVEELREQILRDARAAKDYFYAMYGG